MSRPATSAIRPWPIADMVTWWLGSGHDPIRRPHPPSPNSLAASCEHREPLCAGSGPARPISTTISYEGRGRRGRARETHADRSPRRAAIVGCDGRLREGVVDRPQFAVHVRSDLLHAADQETRDHASDQAVLDGSFAALVAKEGSQMFHDDNLPWGKLKITRGNTYICCARDGSRAFR